MLVLAPPTTETVWTDGGGGSLTIYVMNRQDRESLPSSPLLSATLALLFSRSYICLWFYFLLAGVRGTTASIAQIGKPSPAASSSSSSTHHQHGGGEGRHLSTGEGTTPSAEYPSTRSTLSAPSPPVDAFIFPFSVRFLVSISFRFMPCLWCFRVK